MSQKRRARTPEERAANTAAMRERRARLTPEERVAIRTSQRVQERAAYARLTPEQRAAKSNRRSPLSEEQREKHRHRGRVENLTEPQRERKRQRARERERRVRSNWTPEEREAALKHQRESARQRRATRTPEQRAFHTLRQSAKKWGFDPDVIVAHFLSHNGLCDICGRTALDAGCRSRRLAIDHDHETGAFRGLLCEHCNHALGKMGDSPDRLIAAAEYLLKARARDAQ